MNKEEYAASELSKIGKPDTAIILGTGLGTMEGSISAEHVVNYGDIPGFPVSSVKGHSGRLILGRLKAHPVVTMSGRSHLYEGYSAKEVTFPIRVFALMGIKRIFISNAAGGLRPELKPGNIMIIRDHINLTGRNPLAGPNDERLGLRFPDMTEPYGLSLMKLALSTASELGINLRKGVYVQVLGPSMETAAETRMLHMIGADAVGMSSVMEVIEAVHCGMDVMAISAITNYNDPENYTPAPLDEILTVAENTAPKISQIFKGVLEKIKPGRGY